MSAAIGGVAAILSPSERKPRSSVADTISNEDLRQALPDPKEWEKDLMLEMLMIDG